VGSTRDDAAGEAFDKVAWALDLGYPGGPIVDSYSKDGDPGAFRFPRARIRGNSMDFSFSGIKTAVVQFIEERKKKCRGKLSLRETRDICASFQEAVVDMLLEKAFRAAEGLNIRTIVVCGGVAANSRIRARFPEQARRVGAKILFPSPALCTDNGAMIAGIGYHYLKAGNSDELDLDAYGS
jgi:N6-L-threonylcarbamoyladenine synthase